jgi:hypothetical protein
MLKRSVDVTGCIGVRGEITNLPDIIVESHDGARKIERRVERIRHVIRIRVNGVWVSYNLALLLVESSRALQSSL